MSDRSLVTERLKDVLEALERIPRRFAGITASEDFFDNPEGQDRLDAICMVLVAVGEAFKQSRQANGRQAAGLHLEPIFEDDSGWKRKHIGCTGIGGRVVGLVTVNAGGATVLA